jgi:Mg2+/Co2+ transporter CorB
MSTELVLVVALVSLVLSAFFSGAETGFMSTSRVRLRGGSSPDTPRTRQLMHMLRDIEDPIMTCLIGTNLFNVTFTAVVTATLTAHFAARGQWISLVLCSVVIILLGEILPKVLFREFPERLTLAAVPVVAKAKAEVWIAAVSRPCC